jgi:hypothetical protein
VSELFGERARLESWRVVFLENWVDNHLLWRYRWSYGRTIMVDLEFELEHAFLRFGHGGPATNGSDGIGVVTRRPVATGDSFCD